MAPIERKRPRFREAQQKPRKKQRTDGKKETAFDTTYSVHALPWNEVTLPDKLDDAEGFFGLEEISDVEIVRESKAGKVEYKVRKESNEFTKRPTTSTEDAEEWEGFGDSEVEGRIAIGKSNDVGDAKNSVPRVGNNKDKKRKEYNSLKSSKREANLSGGNQFERLDEDEEDSGEDDTDGRVASHSREIPMANATSVCVAFSQPLRRDTCVPCPTELFQSNTNSAVCDTTYYGRP